MGMSCLEMPLVMGYKRVPEPPARIIPFMGPSLSRSLADMSEIVNGVIARAKGRK